MHSRFIHVVANAGFPDFHGQIIFMWVCGGVVRESERERLRERERYFCCAGDRT
jgi:hypothetical protein